MKNAEQVLLSVFLVLFFALAADVTHKLRTTDIHGAVESIVLAQGGAQ